MTQLGWAAVMTQVIAAEVRRYRKERRLSAQQLANRCSKLGMEITRSTLADLENGRRATLTVAELIVLAAALEVPPVLLALPVAREQTVEVLPGQKVSTWRAALWWRGEGATLDEAGRFDPSTDTGGRKRRANAIDWLIRHQRLVDAWESMALAAQSAALALRRGNRERPGAFEYYQRAAESFEIELTELRSDMAAQGLIPPPLPPDLAHLGDGDGDGQQEGQ